MRRVVNFGTAVLAVLAALPAGAADQPATDQRTAEVLDLFKGTCGMQATTIADVDDQIDIRTGGGMAVGVEPAERHVRAGEQRQGEGTRRPFRQGARAPRHRHRAVGRDEAIEIPAAGLETVDVQLRGVIRIAGGGDAAATDDAEIGRASCRERV